MADVKISALNSLAGADLVAADVVAVVDDSASETKKLTVSDLIANGVTLISNSTIPSAKILFAAGSVATASVADAGITTAKVANSSITAAKLADNSSVTLVSSLPASGDFVGQVALDTDDSKIYVWSGSAWTSVKGAGSINVVNGSTSGIVNITTSTSGDTVTVSTTLDDTTAAKQFLAGPTGAGGTVGYRAIASGDLPTATSSAKGAVAVNGNGLTMSNDEIQIDNSVTAETTEHHLVQYDANGLITAGRVIAASDLPEATSSAKGAVVPGSGLSVASGGTLNHTNSTTAGTYTKVTVDAQGHVTSAVTLAAADIPDLDAAKITTGTFPTARLADDAVTAAKLADQSVTKFGGAGATDNVVTFPDGDYKGQFFFDEKNEDLYVYTGESFLPITVISGNLVNAGTYDASTNLLSSVTTAGSAAGFTNGAALPAPASGNLNYYVVVDTSGTGSGNAPAVALAPPDMLISLGVAGTTFQLIDVSNAIAGQTAANISVVATGNIAATDVQAALQELDTEKLAKAGGTMTGNLELGNGIVIVFEGATDDGFETTLTVADPTADRTITLPNETGTVVTTGSSGVVTSTMITDGTIVNADINASAEIAVSKLANGSARQLLQTDVAGTGVEFTSNVDVPGTFDVTGAATFDSTAAVTSALTVTGVINADGKVKFPAGTANAPSFYNGTDTDTGLYFSAANEISVATGGTQRVVVDSSGRLGIGTGSPSSLLEVSGATPQIKSTDTDVSNSYSVFQNSSGLSVYNAVNNGGAGQHLFQANGSEKVRIDSSGNCGIGTSLPQNELHVSSSGSTYINVEGGTTSTTGILFGDSGDQDIGQILYSNSDNSMRFVTNTSEQFRIDSSGRVGIGDTTPTAKLDLLDDGDAMIRIKTSGTGSGDSSILSLQVTNTSADNNIYFGDPDDSNAGQIRYDHGSNFMSFNTSGSERLRVDSSGNLGVGTSSPGNKLTIDGGTGAATTRGVLSVRQKGNGEDDGISLTSGFANAALIYMDANGEFTLGTSRSTGHKIVFDTDTGNVGIGGTPGTEQLLVRQSAVTDAPQRVAALYLENNANCEIQFVGNSSNDCQLRFGTSNNSFKGALEYQLDNNALLAYVNGSERVRINSSGDVGIGTSNPGGPLEVETGTGERIILDSAGANEQPRIQLIRDGGADWSIQNSIGNFEIVKGSDDVYRYANDVHQFHTAGTGERVRIDSSGRLLVARTSSTGSGEDIQDSKGGIRAIPQNSRTAAYTLVVGDVGKHINITTGGVTVPSGVFSTGDAVTIYNDSSSDQTVTQGSSVTLRSAGTADTGNRTLAQRGICTLLCVASNEFVISGAGLS